MKTILTLIFALFLSLYNYAQSVNDYKYVVVPEKFDFIKSNDEYQLNSLTKFLFNKYGFEAYLNGELMPFSLNEQRCSTLYADVISDSGFIRNKLQVVLRDCNEKVIFKTSFGSSKDKDYQKSYQKALREAFYDIQALRYSYSKVSQTQEENKKDNARVAEILEVGDTAAPEVINTVTQKTITDRVYKSSEISETVVYTSEDGFYKARKEDDLLTFLEGSKVIGVTIIDVDEAFPVTTAQFSGSAYFLEGRLIVQRKIKGIVDPVEIIFTKQ